MGWIWLNKPASLGGPSDARWYPPCYANIGMIPSMLEDSIPLLIQRPALLPGLCARLSSPARAHPASMEIAWTKSSVEQGLSPTRKDRSCPCFKESRDGKRGLCLKTCYSTQFHGLSSFSPSIMGKNVDKPCKIGSVSSWLPGSNLRTSQPGDAQPGDTVIPNQIYKNPPVVSNF